MQLRTFIALAFLFFSTAPAAIEPPRTLDDFADASRWKASASDQVSAVLRKDGDGLCLAYDFHGVSGYASMRRPLALDYSADYEFDVRVRGHGPENALQFKLTDAANENVWWVNRGAFAPPADWTPLRFKKREVSFAWGPLTDHDLHRSEALEFTVYADKGGSGEVCFAGLVFRERTPPPATSPRPIATASSSTPGHPAAYAVDGDPATSWHSVKSHHSDSILTLDLGYEREFGGLVLHWKSPNWARHFEIDFSNDARKWRNVRSVTVGNGGVDPLYLPDSEARYVRISMLGEPGPYELSEVEVRDLAFGDSANAFFSTLAKSAPRGWYPRGFYDEQTYWTVVGVDGGHETGLFSEDGALEVSRGGFSIAPIVADGDGKVSTWADAAATHSLADGYLPIPSVAWQTRDFALTTTAFAAGKRGASTLFAQYVLENASDTPRDLTFALVVQPFQVNPAVQFLNTPGGVSPIHDLALAGTTLSVDGKPRAFAMKPPDAAFGSPFDAGLAIEHIARFGTKTPANTFAVRDPTGLASGALLYRVKLAPHASAAFALAIPLEGAATPVSTPGEIESRLEQTKAAWRDTLNRTSIRIGNAKPLADTLRTALADILISRDGPALRPGTRSYARSWIRDGAMMSAALLRLGHDDAARDYLEWYAPHQFASGKVPCCVDARGSDPVPENDSHGELIYLAGETYRYTNDRALLETMWPHVDAAAHYMDSLRESERGETNPAFRGLMPASISHEGYSAKPMHSYWDDFWALTGYDDAVMIADALGKSSDAKRLARSRDEFRGDLYASIRRSVADHGIDYLPGCAELGDFDATSTTIALAPAGQQAALPQDLLHNTFERYWKQFEARRDGAVAWKDYTPYEWRTVSTFVRLGWRGRAQQAIDFFMRDRRPAAWNQWAEVVGRDARESRFVGDMPHGWVASDFIRSALDLFAYERESDRSLVIAAGIPDAWLDGEGVTIANLKTPYGPLGYSLRHEGDALHLHIDAGTRVPPGGFVFPWSGSGIARVNGKTVRAENGELHITSLPADLTVAAR